jgi:hypothetical protein
MSYQGVDTVARFSADKAKQLRSMGMSFVGRYLGPASWGKTITRSEADALLAAGLSILLCYETSAERMRGGAAAGEIDGLNARNYAQDLGLPAGTTIYFACDYNAPTGDLILCESYIRAAQAALGGIYEAGVYGPEKVVSFLSERGACDKFWQCVAWSNQFLPVANVRQYAWQGDARAKAMAAACGIAAVDLDAGEDLRGLWRPKETATHWYDDTVLWAEKEGVISPTPTIADARPEDPATRAEVMQMIRNYNRRFEDADTKTASGLLAD